MKRASGTMEIAVEVDPPGRPSRARAGAAGPRLLPYQLEAEWVRDRGWGPARICRMAPWRLPPFTAVLHYAQAIFEGLKARRTASGRTALFRVQAHARRFALSARRMALPVLPEEAFAACVVAFTRHQRAQIRGGQALYLRPLMFASEEMLGARPSARCAFAVLGAVVEEPANPGWLGVFADPRFARTAPGGTGAAKTSGNYAAALLAQSEAVRRGFHQPLFLDAREHAFVEETGATNVMFHSRGRLLTPPLGDTVLDGVTRRSVMALAPALGLEVVERPLAWRQVLAGVKRGRITEALATGTGAGVMSIRRLGSPEETVELGEGEVGPRLQEALRAEHLGQGRRSWLTYVD